MTDFFGVKLTDLQSSAGSARSPCRGRSACTFARRHTRFSLEEIGGHFGGRDHTTVMHAVRTIQDRCETDIEFSKVVAAIESQVRTAPMPVTV